MQWSSKEEMADEKGKKSAAYDLRPFSPPLEHLRVILVRDGCTDKIRAPRLA